MAHSAQARKRARQSDKARIRNKSVRNEIKTLTKTLLEKVDAKDGAAAREIFKTVVSKLDKAAKSNVYHRNSVARQKSKIAAIVNAVK